jgi:multiple sugar transport system permease protein
MEEKMEAIKKRKKIKKAPYLLLMPAVTFICVIVIYPMIRTVGYSLTDYKIWKADSIQFVGINNYARLFKNSDFLLSFTNTFKWVAIILTFQFVIGLMMALILNEKFKLNGFVRGLVLIPWVTPSIMTALMWVWMYHGNFGIINYILTSLKITNDNIPFLAQASTSLYSCAVTAIWQGVPFFAIMLLAGLKSIPVEHYEAAYVDGASRLKSFLHITLPGLKDIIYVTTLLRLIWIANSVDLIYLMTGGGPANSSLTLSVYTYLTAQKGFDFGNSSAMAVCLTLLLTVFALFYVRKINMGKDQ